ncbi:MAG: hypothetical protein FJ042_02450 [Candidatus Cloacimonetes bacterium]|nr:hypothetical protein [Candidatus Cloacimonadota bacterium]
MKPSFNSVFLSPFRRAQWLFILILPLFLLSACPGKRPVVPEQQAVRVNYLTAEVPAWMMDLPEGDYTIGIAWRPTMFDSDSEDAARDFAAVSFSRNHSAYVVDKSLVYSLSQMQEIDWNNVNFKVVVSADTTFLRRSARDLILLDKVEIHGFLIALFGFNQIETDETPRLMHMTTKPVWCDQTNLFISGESVVTTGTALSANLFDAWTQAQETALRTIARYQVQRVVSRLLVNNDWMQQYTQMETVLRNQRVYLRRSFIEFRQIENQPSYKVYLQFKADR